MVPGLLRRVLKLHVRSRRIQIHDVGIGCLNVSELKSLLEISRVLGNLKKQENYSMPSQIAMPSEHHESAECLLTPFSVFYPLMLYYDFNYIFLTKLKHDTYISETNLKWRTTNVSLTNQQLD
jgi:hypothetical protein